MRLAQQRQHLLHGVEQLEQRVRLFLFAELFEVTGDATYTVVPDQVGVDFRIPRIGVLEHRLRACPKLLGDLDRIPRCLANLRMAFTPDDPEGARGVQRRAAVVAGVNARCKGIAVRGAFHVPVEDDRKA